MWLLAIARSPVVLSGCCSLSPGSSHPHASSSFWVPRPAQLQLDEVGRRLRLEVRLDVEDVAIGAVVVGDIPLDEFEAAKVPTDAARTARSN